MSLTADEIGLIGHLLSKLKHHEVKNEELERYYEGKNRLKDLGISIPPALKLVDTVVGWAGTAVDVLEERLDLEGFIGGDAFGVNDIFRANELELESSLGHKDALIYGVGFVVVGKGRPELGEPNELITIESPKKMTAVYDMRTRRLAAALLVERHGRELEAATLYLPDQTVWVEFKGDKPFEVMRDVHNLGRVPVAPLVNNPRSGDPDGRSEITRAVRSYTDSVMRTLLGAEVAREFYSSPQRYVMGAKEDVFLDSDGNAINPWSVIQGRLIGVPYNDDDNVMPTIGQFTANSPAPYFEQVRQYAQLIAAETAIPASYLGFQTDNPSSADAIRQMEARLVKRAERRQRQFGRAWTEVAKLALLVRDGSLPADVQNIRPIWRDAATPTRAAAADEAVKLIQAGVLTATSDVTLNRLGFSDSDKQQLKSEQAATAAQNFVSDLATAARAATAQTNGQAVTGGGQ